MAGQESEIQGMNQVEADLEEIINLILGTQIVNEE